MTFADKKRSILASLLLVLFLSFQGGRMLCYHTHVFGNNVITHSHPFNNPDRQHSAAELESFAIITTGLLTDNSADKPELPLPSFEDVSVSIIITSHTSKGYHHTTDGRAPPFAHVI